MDRPPKWFTPACAVVGGTLGAAALLFRRRWALPLLLASVAGVVVQDLALFFSVGRSAQPATAVFALQAMVPAVAVGLALLARKASAQSWLR